MKKPHEKLPEYTLTTKRIEALSDGVFAIVMTLLVIEIKVPEVSSQAGRSEFLNSLSHLWPEFFYYMTSFVILGVYWMGHHKQFHYIKRSDGVLMWLNIFFLMFISLIPFSTAFLGKYPLRHFPIVFYSVHLSIVAILLYTKWVYATSKSRLTRKNLHPAVITRGKRKILTGIVIYLLTVIVSYYSVRIGILLFMLVPILYILPGKKIQTQSLE